MSVSESSDISDIESERGSYKRANSDAEEVKSNDDRKSNSGDSDSLPHEEDRASSSEQELVVEEKYGSGSGSESERDDEIEEEKSSEDESEEETERENSSSENDDEYYEEDKEEYGRSQRKKKKKPRFGGGFIIDEAEVDDEVEEEEEWEEGAEELGIVGNEIEERGLTARDIEMHYRGNTDSVWNSEKGNEFEEYLRKKYGDKCITGTSDHLGDRRVQSSDYITQQTLLPGVKDPNLWMVKCRVGEEKATVVYMMRKYIAYQFSSQPLKIKSVIAVEGVKGYIYVEAYKQPHVKEAILNVTNLKMGQWKQQLVPFKEMTDVLRVVKQQDGLKEKQWVRLRRGMYKDDIAQVDYVELAQNQVHLKLLPRIDYTRPRGALRSSKSDNKGVKRRWKRRPPAKSFDPEAIKSAGGEVTSDGDFLVFEGNRYSQKGFLYKTFPMNAIIADGVKPTLSELEKFEEAPESIGIEVQNVNPKGKGNVITHNFLTDDNVEVIEGELMNLCGKVLSIDGNVITIMPALKDLNEPIEFQASELKKYFKQGDHVKVLAGRYQGETGLIIRVEENRVILLSDLTMYELEVLPNDVHLCSDTATGVDSLGQFQWGDFVQLDPQNVGVIVKLEHDSFHVLNTQGKVLALRPQALQKRKDSNYAVALDSEQNSIRRKDIVKVIDGSHSGRDGEIRHLYRNIAFLHSRMYLENGGIFVCKAKHLQLVGGLKVTMSPRGASLGGFMSPILPGTSRGTPVGRGRGTGVQRDREVIGQTVKITHGPYKVGSKTPHYDSINSSQDGSRTPGQSGAWDPSIANTPGRKSDSEASPSQTYSLNKACLQTGELYSPQTPGSLFGSEQSSSPYQLSPSPIVLNEAAKLNSPGLIATPSSVDSSIIATPLGYSPLTPRHTSSPYGPYTPIVGLEHLATWQQDWLTIDIEVLVKDCHSDAGLRGQTGVVRGISGTMSSIFLPAEDRVVNIFQEYLEPVAPKRSDQVKVILGDDREAVGCLLSIDCEDGVVKLTNGELKLLPLRYLCRMKT
ncbi:transcription elongation factor SPT5-like isoform X2 [Periplaneta americana]|uniref:transcription elongation factor SPT5-like isoform X2 n=1 Tax=Periplaneta americana TaxID=6978 RepID=UPI0037E86630